MSQRRQERNVICTMAKNFEKLSAKELEMLKRLEDKRKRIEEHDEEFFDEVKSRLDEVKEKFSLGLSDSSEKVSKYDESKIDEVLKAYDCSFDEFVDYVLNEKQIDAYLEKESTETFEENVEENRDKKLFGF